jgi:hypothetical protein
MAWTWTGPESTPRPKRRRNSENPGSAVTDDASVLYAYGYTGHVPDDVTWGDSVSGVPWDDYGWQEWDRRGWEEREADWLEDVSVVFAEFAGVL